MNQPNRRVIPTAAVLGLLAATAGQARAGTIVTFSYSGNGGPDNQGFLSTGAGSFSFANNLAGVGLGNLTSFNFTLNEMLVNENGPPNTVNTVQYGLADLNSFTAFVGPGPTLTALTLDTHGVVGSEYGSHARELTVSSLTPPAACTHMIIFGFPISLTSGTVTINSVTTAVPEPSSFTLAVLGALIVAGGWSRRRKATEIA
jgi:hypothetical protein